MLAKIRMNVYVLPLMTGRLNRRRSRKSPCQKGKHCLRSITWLICSSKQQQPAHQFAFCYDGASHNVLMITGPGP